MNITITFFIFEYRWENTRKQMSFHIIISVTKSFLTSKIFTSSTSQVLWCIVTKLSFSGYSANDETPSWCTYLIALSCTQVIRLFNSLLWNIQIINLCIYIVGIWPNILQKSCIVHNARFLKYVWPFFNIINERVKGQ